MGGSYEYPQNPAEDSVPAELDGRQGCQCCHGEMFQQVTTNLLLQGPASGWVSGAEIGYREADPHQHQLAHRTTATERGTDWMTEKES